MVVWMEVTKDNYELPIVIANTAGDLAKMCGAKVSTVKTSASRYNKGKDKGRFCKYRSVKI